MFYEMLEVVIVRGFFTKPGSNWLLSKGVGGQEAKP